MGEDSTMNTNAIHKQALQRQLIELESAIEELDTQEAWKVIGNIMIKKDPKALKQELTEKKAGVEQRLALIEKHASN